MAEMPTKESVLGLRSLDALIEAEVVDLVQVRGALRVLHDVLMYSDDDDGGLHAEVALTVARLIDECIAQLEAIVARIKAGEFAAARPSDRSGP